MHERRKNPDSLEHPIESVVITQSQCTLFQPDDKDMIHDSAALVTVCAQLLEQWSLQAQVCQQLQLQPAP